MNSGEKIKGFTPESIKGFTPESIAALRLAGWVPGTECGYRNHPGFVYAGDSPVNPGTTYSLTPSRKPGVYTIAVIRNGVCDYSNDKNITEVLTYFGA